MQYNINERVTQNNPQPLALNPDSTLKNYDAIMICGYGGPRRPADVVPFMRNATKGRGIPDERLAQVGQHYQLFNGLSPINAHLAALRRSLELELRRRNVDIEVVVGNRNWTPFFYDVLSDLSKQGKTRILCIFAAAYVCYSCCRQYREDLAQAAAELAERDLTVTFDKIPAFANSNGFISANAELLAQSVEAELAKETANRTEANTKSSTLYPIKTGHSTKMHVCFVTHSIPQTMEECSGTKSGGPSYQQQHLEVCAEVAKRAQAILINKSISVELTWDLSFCSRSGPPQSRWIEPDINNRLEELAKQGVNRVLVSPVGFICDHMEVIYDLDTEAKATATKLQLEFQRVPTVGTHPKFVAALADLVLERDQNTVQPKQSNRVPALDHNSTNTATAAIIDSLETAPKFELNWGKPILPYRWPAWPLADEQKASPNAPVLPAVMQIENFSSTQ